MSKRNATGCRTSTNGDKAGSSERTLAQAAPPPPWRIDGSAYACPMTSSLICRLSIDGVRSGPNVCLIETQGRRE